MQQEQAVMSIIGDPGHWRQPAEEMNRPPLNVILWSAANIGLERVKRSSP
jgi:hypothetical protein